MSGIELALAVIPLVIAVIQHRRPLARVGRAVLTSKRSTEQRNERSDFYSQLYLELSMLHYTLQRLAGDVPAGDYQALQTHVHGALGTGLEVFEDTLRDVLQSFDDIVSTKSLGLEGMKLERTMLARLKYIKNAANTPETKQSLRERLRLTKNEKSQRVAMKRIRAGNDRLFILMGPPMELEYYRSRKPGGIDILTKRPGTARGRKVLEPSYRRLAKKWPKGCCSQFQHEARLSLSSCCNPHRNPDDGINMVVSLPGENDDQPNWQKLSMTALQERTVHFADGGEAQQSSANSHKRDVDSESLCSLLHQALDNGADLRIGLEKEKLWQLGSELATWKIREQSGTPLKDFLPGSPQSWRLRERSILAVILSHAVLHCLESPWLCNNWSKEHVVFFRKESSTEFEFDQPFLKVEFQEEDSEPVPFDPVSIHGNPIILALGILLLEIYTQTALESRREGQHSSDRESNANTNLTTAITFLKELDGDLRLKYRQAVKECLYWNDVQLDGDSLRQRIYDRIVEPLERELVEGFPDAENLFHICGQYSKEE